MMKKLPQKEPLKVAQAINFRSVYAHEFERILRDLVDDLPSA